MAVKYFVPNQLSPFFISYAEAVIFFIAARLHNNILFL
jgi:hypothetical protein